MDLETRIVFAFSFQLRAPAKPGIAHLKKNTLTHGCGAV
jgi:hypothetical protein